MKKARENAIAKKKRNKSNKKRQKTSERMELSTAFTEKAKSIEQMREEHVAELERREDLVMSFLVVLFFFIWFSSLSLVLCSVILL